ncbi:MAG: 1-acyl-sn-glycerol-3-phosphate acyltransferase [Myxococcaceae bacterium]
MGTSQLAPTAAYSAAFVLGLKRWFLPVARLWFRPTVSGWEHLPETPFLCVANHSGYGVMEILTLLCLWVERCGLTRPVVGLAHDLGLWWPFRLVVLRIGGVRASSAAGLDPLARGFPVLVFPGGDLDALRPFSARDQVVWGGRHGFLRTARDARVPVVPLVISGSHAQYTLLPGGPFIARLLGLRRLRLATWPLPLGGCVVLGVFAAWLAGLLPGYAVGVALALAFWPNPTRIDYRFLSSEAPPAPELEGTALAEQAEALRRRMERALGELAATRRTPWG